MTRLNDLNSISWFCWLTLSRLTAKEISSEPRSHCVCSADQVSFSQRIPALRCTLWGQQERPFVLLLGSVSHHGFRSTYLSRKPARYRSLSDGPASQALSRRLQWPCQTFHFGRRQRDSRLAHLSRLRPKSDRDSASTLCSFRAGSRTRGDRLRFRRHHHRPLSVPLPLGQIQKAQGRDQTTHLAGDSQRDSRVYRYYPWRCPRGQSPRRDRSRTRLLPGDGPWLPRFPAPLQTANGALLLCHSHQKQSPVSAALLPSARSGYWRAQRSNHCADGSLDFHALSARFATRALLLSRNRPAPGVANQQLFHPRVDGRGPLSLSLANRTLLQMDQTTSPYQKFFRHFRQQRQDTGLDRRHCLCAYCNRQKALGTQARSLHFATDSESHPFRENPHFKLASAISVQS